MRADLHCHSTASDGTGPPAEVMARARAAGLDVIALTDHDTVAGHAEAAGALPAGLTLVPGIELSCRLRGRSVHLLGYLFDPADQALAAECAKIREHRIARARAIVDRLAGLGVPVTWEQVSSIAGGGVVGRPHIARAMVAAGVVGSPDPVRAITLIRAAGGVAVLAHPGAPARGALMPDADIARLAAAGLAGIEVRHPDHNQEERSHLTALAAELDVVASGGSDDHGGLTGYRIGCDTIAPQAYERLVTQAVGAAPVSRQ